MLLSSFPTLIWILGSVLIVSLTSFIGVALLSLGEALLKRLLLTFVSFAAGAMLGNVFFHLLPEITAESPNVRLSLGLVLAGMLLSFLIERFIHWHHCHEPDCGHVHPAGRMILMGDSVHNALDGILIASTYLADVRLGLATTIAVVLHEIPQEIGDFSVLMHSGYTRGRALFLNFLSALVAFAGAGIVLLVEVNTGGVETILLPLAAGNLLYIAAVDLLPELHKEVRIRQGIVQLVAIVIGAGLLFVLTKGA